MNMKKLVYFVLCILFVMMLAGCGSKPFTCFVCGAESNGKSYKAQMFGDEVLLCENCNQTMKTLNDAFSESMTNSK